GDRPLPNQEGPRGGCTEAGWPVGPTLTWGDRPLPNQEGPRSGCTEAGWPVGPTQKIDDLSAHVAQSAERVLGKDEVTSSILVVGSAQISRSHGWLERDHGWCKRHRRLAGRWAGVTQWLESRPSKPLVAGSNPVSRSS